MKRDFFTIKKIDVTKWMIIPRERLERLFIIRKRTIVKVFLYITVLIVVYGSLNPWFMWPISRYYYFLAALPISACLLLDRNIQDRLFIGTKWQWPYLTCLIISLVIVLVNAGNILGLLRAVISTLPFYAVFRLRRNELMNLSDFMAKTLAVLMCISIPFYVMFLLGYPLPHYHIANKELMYSYENYTFFLLDDRAALSLIPRFHSVFLEPGHLGTFSAFMLMAQIGRWGKWYNVILFVTTFMTFSLAAYVLLAMILFISAWVRRKAILGKIIFIISLLAAVVVVSLFYNKGENMVNGLIVQRLTIDDEGRLTGDNRVTETFEKEFNKFIVSDDLLLGKEYKALKYGWGNSGFRVFMYDFGLISLLFVLAFYTAVSLNCHDRRVAISMWIVFLSSFLVRATPLYFYYFLPLFLFTRLDLGLLVENKEKCAEEDNLIKLGENYNA